jgi:hypothetical protein
MMALVGDEHFAHAGAAAGPLVADDDDVAGLDRAVEDFFSACFLGIEDAGDALETQAFLAGDFGHGAARGEVAVEDDEVAVLFDGIESGRMISWSAG